jgi:hypothetical protein
MNKFRIAAVALLITTLAACGGSHHNSANNQETKTAKAQLGQFLQSQPVPVFTHSQLRQNLIEIETAQANATATTSFMFLMAGSGTTGPLVQSCPSIGFPIPATYQLTNPDQIVNGDNGRVSTIAQLEANGVYTSGTTGTYVICVDPNGTPYAFYHEGFVSTVSGPAHWDNTKGEIVMDGASSAVFTKVKP